MLRAGQSVTVAAHEVMVTISVEKTVDSEAGAPASFWAGVAATAAELVVELPEEHDLMEKGLEYWKVLPEESPS